MRRRKTVYAAAILSVAAFFSFTTDEKIAWSADHKLTWSDFKGKHNIPPPQDALTNSDISLTTVNTTNDSIRLQIICYFNPLKSSATTKPKSDKLLRHEQGHFDLTEIYARLLRKKLSEAKVSGKSATSEVTAIYKKNFAECQKEQKKYDKETKHSLIEDKQKERNADIEKRLKESEKYNFHFLTLKYK